jgi:hypothetical protein
MAPGTLPADFPGRDCLFFGQILLELWAIPAADSFLVISALVLPDSNPSKKEECKTNDRQIYPAIYEQTEKNPKEFNVAFFWSDTVQ